MQALKQFMPTHIWLKKVVELKNWGFPKKKKKDCYNYINSQKMVLIEGGDSQSLVSYFKCKANEEGGMFYWNVQVDQERQMTNFYRRDRRSIND